MHLNGGEDDKPFTAKLMGYDISYCIEPNHCYILDGNLCTLVQ